LGGVDERDRGGLTGLGYVEPLLEELVAGGNAGVGGDLADSAMVVGEDFGAAFGLDVVVSGSSTPPDVGCAARLTGPKLGCKAHLRDTVVA
jgi:hypothetical protein